MNICENNKNFVVASGFARCILSLANFSDSARSVVDVIASVLSIEEGLPRQISSVSLITYNLKRKENANEQCENEQCEIYL